MAKLTLGKKSFDLPDSIADGEVVDTCKRLTSAISEFAKSGKSETVRKLLDEIVKTAIPKDQKEAKSDKKAQGILEDIKKFAGELSKAIDKPGTVKVSGL